MEHEETSPEAVYSQGNHSCGSLKLKFALTDSPESSSSSNHSLLDLSIDVHSDSELILTPPKANELIEEICCEDRVCTRTKKNLGQQSVQGKPAAVSPPVAKEQRDFFDSCCKGTNHVYPKQGQGYDHVQEFTCTSARKHNRRHCTAKQDELLVYNMRSVTTRRGCGTHEDECHMKVMEEPECMKSPPMMEQQDTRTTGSLCEDIKMDRIGLRFSEDSIQQKECVIKLLRLSLHLMESSQSDYFPFDSLVSLLENDSKVASEKMEKKHHRELLKVKEEHKKDIIDLQDRMLKWMCSRIDLVHQQENTILQLDRELESMRSICFKLKKRSSQLADKGTQSVAPIDSSGCGSGEDSKRIYSNCRKSMDAKDGALHCDADYNNKLKCRKGAETNTAIVRQPNAAIHGEQDSVVSRLTIYDTATAEKLFKDICYNSSTKGYDSNYFIPCKKSGHADDGCCEEEFVDALSDAM